MNRILWTVRYSSVISQVCLDELTVISDIFLLQIVCLAPDDAMEQDDS